MKKLIGICACLILFSVFLIPRSSGYSQRPDNNSRFADDRIVIKLKPEAARAIVDDDLIAEEIVRAPGVRTERLTPRGRAGAELLHLEGRLSVEEAVQRANEDPRVEYAEPDYFVHTMETVPNDGFWGVLWGLNGRTPGAPGIYATKAWDLTTGSDDIVVAVLDTGVDLKHEDLAANAWVNPREIPGNGVDDDANGFVDDVNGWNFFDGNNQTF